MSMLSFRACFAVAVLCLPTLALPARPLMGQAALSRFSVDLALGGGRGSGGVRRSRTGEAADALVAWRARALGRPAPVGGAAYSLFTLTGGEDVVCLPSPRGGCLTNDPLIGSVSVLGGVEVAARNGAAVRILAGPAIHQVEGGTYTGGFVARADAGTAALWRLRLRPLLRPSSACAPQFFPATRHQLDQSTRRSAESAP
jgi:hypothetical protein